MKFCVEWYRFHVSSCNTARATDAQDEEEGEEQFLKLLISAITFATIEISKRNFDTMCAPMGPTILPSFSEIGSGVRERGGILPQKVRTKRTPNI